MNGEGTFSKINGDKIIGSWKNNMIDGFAKSSSKNNEFYEGNWLKD